MPLIIVFASTFSTAASASDDVTCLVSDVKEAYAEAQNGITKSVRDDIEEKSPSDDQDFTEMGCIDSFGISAGYSLPDIDLSDEICEAAKDYVNGQLGALNDVVNSYEMPPGMDAGLDMSVSNEKGDDESEFNNKYLQKLDAYRNKLQESADNITKDRKGGTSYTPEMPSEESR
ncbi:hypothetical protein EZI54_07255 [Marinobacter halodurans]|uniref:Uncharacterized protein n=1 Tax=Marinobacter halodurans TaxID=2528979 RepID=A0ABY1ZMA5_9GAMM|nr:hypothetical protein [Marinobacter halodurans]TBW57449.1 hypothetical protein EZI54_07255 [Marinobacter halodurans]